VEQARGLGPSGDVSGNSHRMPERSKHGPVRCRERTIARQDQGGWHGQKLIWAKRDGESEKRDNPSRGNRKTDTLYRAGGTVRPIGNQVLEAASLREVPLQLGGGDVVAGEGAASPWPVRVDNPDL